MSRTPSIGCERRERGSWGATRPPPPGGNEGGSPARGRPRSKKGGGGAGGPRNPGAPRVAGGGRGGPGRDRHFLLHGASGRFLGMFPFLERLEAKRYKQYIRVFLRQYQLAKTCPACGGARLKPEALAVRVGGKSIAQAAALTARELADWVAAPALPPLPTAVAVHILAELAARVAFVNDVGLGYLTLDRLTRTLSGGEAQRIALSNALGSHLVDTLYVLDEPTIGLHPADTGRLLGLLRRLADGGNTVVVVEHDPAAMRAADWMVELGPGSGEAGGARAYQGPAAGGRAAGAPTGQDPAGGERSGGAAGPPPARPR